MKKLFAGGLTAVLLLSGILTAVPLTAQPAPLSYDEGTTGLGLALRRLPVTARFLHTAAHPDDEDNGLLVKLSRGRGVRTGLLTLTRGDGGQNEIGPELFQALGVIRTEELMSMHRYDRVDQFFGLAYEFGYSFSVEETFERWGYEETLGDVVRVIRRFRPDVVVSLPRFGAGGGQHHQAAALLTEEAFRAAADPARFPEQLREGLRPWQALKLYERVGWLGTSGPSDGEARPVVSVKTGTFDPLLGRTYHQVGMEARSLHLCQGMPQLRALPGPHFTRWRLVDSVLESPRDEKDLLEGFDLGLTGMVRFLPSPERHPFLEEGLRALQARIDQARRAFDAEEYGRVAEPLAAGLRQLRDLRGKVKENRLDETTRAEVLFRLEAKQEDFEEALRLAVGISAEALTETGIVLRGRTYPVEVTVGNGGGRSVELRDVSVNLPRGWAAASSTEVPARIEAGEALGLRFAVTVSASAPYSRPYWTPNPERDRYDLADPGEDGTRPWSPPPVTVTVAYRVDGVEAEFTVPAQFRYEGPWVGGEQRHEIKVVPEVSLRLDPEISILPSVRAEAGREIRVTALYNGEGPASGTVVLEAPPGWRVLPEEQEFTFQRTGESITRIFTVRPPAGTGEGEFTLSAVGRLGEETFREGYQVIDYHHIQRRHLFHPARTVIRTVDVQVAEEVKVGYVMGPGDRVPEAFQQLGVAYRLLDEDDLAFGDLTDFDVIVTGIRAYLNREDLKSYNHRLLEWVREGGTLIVQYNKFEFNRLEGASPSRTGADSSPFTPYPALVGRGRVTDQNAPVRLLVPDHPLFTFPNSIGERDWSGWVQERGLYFMGRKDSRYRDLLVTEDPWEYNPGVQPGALVEAAYGRGRWIYVGLGLWRQLPAGVPGAYRLFANMLSLPRAE